MSAFTFPLIQTPVFFPNMNPYTLPIQNDPQIEKNDKNQEVILLDDDDESKGEQRELDANGKPKQVRWKKQDDMRLFLYLEEHCRKNSETIADLLEKAENCEETNYFWTKTAKKVKWVGTCTALCKRFISLCTQPHLSCRDVKLFRKLIRKRRKDHRITVNFILDHFPGFDIRTLKELALERKWIKKESDLMPEDNHITYTIKRS